MQFGGPHQHMLPIGDFPPGAPSATTLSASSIVSSQPETERYFPFGGAGPGAGGQLLQQQQQQQQQGFHPPQSERLTADSTMLSVARAMRRPDSGLEVKERVWVGITVPDGFVGSDAVEWLLEHVGGVDERKEAKKMAANMLKKGFIKHAMRNTNFDESRYYSFVDEDFVSAEMASLNLDGSKRATAPLPSLPQQQQHARPLPPPQGPPPIPWQGQPQPYLHQQQFHQQQPPQQQQQPPPMPQWQPAPIGGLADQSIYNPAAPPPSANNYGGYQYGGDLDKTRTGSGTCSD